jgi:hypothetical protein
VSEDVWFASRPRRDELYEGRTLRRERPLPRFVFRTIYVIAPHLHIVIQEGIVIYGRGFTEWVAGKIRNYFIRSGTRELAKSDGDGRDSIKTLSFCFIEMTKSRCGGCY